MSFPAKDGAQPLGQVLAPESRRVAGILFVALPTVIYGGVSILRFLIVDPAYMANPLRQDLWRAGHAHAGVLLILSLVALLYVDGARLPEGMKRAVRGLIPTSALLLPAAFFFSVLSPTATEPNAMIHLAWVGAIVLATGLLILGVGLLRRAPDPPFEEGGRGAGVGRRP